jgi:thioredoxin-dependent peroxiredoxin
MSTILLKGQPIHTVGSLPQKDTIAPDFILVKTDLSDVTLKEFRGKRVLLNIFPSLDTSTCATSVRKFNEKAGSFKNSVVICISKDLPFAHSRFCTTENIHNVITASEFRNNDFGSAYGVTIADGPMSGLLSRAVVIVDENGKVIYSQQVSEIVEEPDYESALKVLEV